MKLMENECYHSSRRATHSRNRIYLSLIHCPYFLPLCSNIIPTPRGGVPYLNTSCLAETSTTIPNRITQGFDKNDILSCSAVTHLEVRGFFFCLRSGTWNYQGIQFDSSCNNWYRRFRHVHDCLEPLKIRSNFVRNVEFVFVHEYFDSKHGVVKQDWSGPKLYDRFIRVRTIDLRLIRFFGWLIFYRASSVSPTYRYLLFVYLVIRNFQSPLRTRQAFIRIPKPERNYISRRICLIECKTQLFATTLPFTRNTHPCLYIHVSPKIRSKAKTTNSEHRLSTEKTCCPNFP